MTRHKHPNAARNRQPGPTGDGVFGAAKSMLFAGDELSKMEGSRLFTEYSLVWRSEIPMVKKIDLMRVMKIKERKLTMESWKTSSDAFQTCI